MMPTLFIPCLLFEPKTLKPAGMRFLRRLKRRDEKKCQAIRGPARSRSHKNDYSADPKAWQINRLYFFYAIAGIALPKRLSMDLRSLRSSGVTKVRAIPWRIIRPVRPIRWV